jgi:hypothetical protein
MMCDVLSFGTLMKTLNTSFTWLLFMIHIQDASQKRGQLTQIFRDFFQSFEVVLGPSTFNITFLSLVIRHTI